MQVTGGVAAREKRELERHNAAALLRDRESDTTGLFDSGGGG